MITTDYLGSVFCREKFAQTVDRSEKDIRDWIAKGNDFDCIAFTGVSGAALAFPLALRLNKGLLCIRKEGSGSHSLYDIEGDFSGDRYIIVDDFVDTGSTVEKIHSDLERNRATDDIELVGIYLYDENSKKRHIEYLAPIIPNSIGDYQEWCNHCGYQAKPYARYCAECGRALNEAYNLRGK